MRSSGWAVRSRIGILGRLMVVAAATGIPVPAGAQDLAGDVRRAISQLKAGETKVGVCIIDVPSGRVLADVRADEQFTPDSNM